MTTVSSKPAWHQWKSDEGKSLEKIFKDRIRMGYMDDAALIVKELPQGKVEQIGTEEFYKLLGANPEGAAMTAKICDLGMKQELAANRWFDKETITGVKHGTTFMAHLLGASRSRVESAGTIESRREFESGNWFYAIDLLERVSMSPKKVLGDLAEQWFSSDKAKDDSGILAKYIATHALDIRCGETTAVPPRTSD